VSLCVFRAPVSTPEEEVPRSDGRANDGYLNDLSSTIQERISRYFKDFKDSLTKTVTKDSSYKAHQASLDTTQTDATDTKPNLHPWRDATIEIILIVAFEGTNKEVQDKNINDGINDDNYEGSFAQQEDNNDGFTKVGAEEIQEAQERPPWHVWQSTCRGR
jgi:hypothetical protein